MSSKNNLFYFLIFLYLLIIAAGSLVAIPFKLRINHGDKIIHGLIYTPLGFLLSLPKISLPRFLNFSLSFGFGSLYGALLELFQGFVPGRTSSWTDEIANMIGVGLGLMIGFFGKKRLPGQR